MNKQNFKIIVSVAILLAGAWMGRLAWRAHRNIVTLDMRNAPLPAVVRAIARQTRENIIIDKQLNAKITIKVKDAPLARVLDLLAAKAGARWQETFAVYASAGALARLEAVLQGGQRLEAAGWTNLAPAIPEMGLQDTPAPDMGNTGEKPLHFMRRLFRGGPGGGGGGGNGMMITFLPDGTVDRWSPQRLIAEADVSRQLAGEIFSAATAQTAARAAAAVRGRSRVYYALEKAPFEMGGPGHPSLPQLGIGHEDIGNAAAALAQERRQEHLRELGNSPEEQVERARQSLHRPAQIRTTEDVR